MQMLFKANVAGDDVTVSFQALCKFHGHIQDEFFALEGHHTGLTPISSRRGHSGHARQRRPYQNGQRRWAGRTATPVSPRQRGHVSDSPEVLQSGLIGTSH